MMRWTLLAVALMVVPRTMSNDPLVDSLDVAQRDTNADEKTTEAECLLHVSLEKTTYKPQQKIAPKIEYQSRAKRALTVWSSGFWPNHQIIIKDEAGDSPALTAEGRRCQEAFAPEGARDKNAPVVLASGGARRVGADVDITTLYELEVSTRYTLQVIYDDRQEPTPLKMTSSPVVFEIAHP